MDQRYDNAIMRQRWIALSRTVLFGFICAVGGIIVGERSNRPAAPLHPRSASLDVLDAVLPEIDLQDVRLDEAIEVLRQRSGSRIDVEWSALRPEFKPGRVRVTYRARNVLLEDALSELVAQINRQAAPGYLPTVDFQPIGNRFVISERDSLSERAMGVVVYDVREIVGPEPPLAVSGPGANAHHAWEKRLEELVRIVQEHVGPDTWTENGGSIGSIHAISTRVVIVQNWRNLRKAERLLAKLRDPVIPSPRVLAETRQAWNPTPHPASATTD